MTLLLDATDTAEAILNLICRFSRIDFDLVSPHLSFVLPVVAKVSPGIQFRGQPSHGWQLP